MGGGVRIAGSRDERTLDLGTLYGVGSITKSYTALAILRLAERDGPSLGDRLTTHPDVDLPNGADPTLAALFPDRSGSPPSG